MKNNYIEIGALLIIVAWLGFFWGTQNIKPSELVLEKLFLDPTFQKKISEYDISLPSDPYIAVDWQQNKIDSSVNNLKCRTQDSSYNFALVTDLTKLRKPVKSPDNFFGDTLIKNLTTNPRLQYFENGATWDFVKIGSNNPSINNYFHKGRNSYVFMTIYNTYGIMSLTFHDEITGSMGDKDFSIDTAIYSCRPA